MEDVPVRLQRGDVTQGPETRWLRCRCPRSSGACNVWNGTKAADWAPSIIAVPICGAAPLGASGAVRKAWAFECPPPNDREFVCRNRGVLT